MKMGILSNIYAYKTTHSFTCANPFVPLTFRKKGGAEMGSTYAFLAVILCLGCAPVPPPAETQTNLSNAQPRMPPFEPDKAFAVRSTPPPDDDELRARIASLNSRAAALRAFRVSFGTRDRVVFE